MRKEEFKNLGEEYIKACEEIIFFDGDCAGMECKSCPFYFENYSGVECINWGKKELLKRTKEILKYIKGEEL